MPSHDRDQIPAAPFVSRADGAVVDETSWGALETFVQQLQGCDRSSDEIELVLQTIHEVIGADIVYWYPGVGREAVVKIGEQRVSGEWCRELTEQHLLTAPFSGGRALLCPEGGPGSEVPKSVAMVQVSKSRSVWIVALRFSPARHFGKADLGMMALARRMLLHQRQQLRAQERLKEALFGLVRGLVAAINAKNQYTSGHSERVARMAVCLGKQMGLRPPALGDLYLAGLLHDIGKIGIRSRVLQQAGPLSARDRAHIEEHPVIGDGIIASIQPLGHLRPGIRNHHERYDGQGYPDRLAGDDIPLMARILAVADAFDAMHSARPYREALPNDKIDAIMADGAGSQWDPEVIGHFMACRHDLHGICQKGIGDSVLVAVEQVVRAGDEDG